MIEVRHLYKIYGPRPKVALQRLLHGSDRGTVGRELNHVVAVNDVSLHVPKGLTYVVMGLSGSGKSTLLRCINRLYEPTAGTVLIDEEDITAASMRRLRDLRGRKIAMVFQHFGLLLHRTVLQNVMFGLEVQRLDRRMIVKRAHEAIALVGLTGWETSYPAQLSGGMQQRVGLARALTVDPDVLLLDEPFSGLDPLTRKKMQRELIHLQDSLKKTIVFITHDLDEALTVGDRIGILRDGQIVQEGSPQEVFLNPVDEHVSDFVQDVNPLIVLTASQAMRRQVTENGPGGSIGNLADKHRNKRGNPPQKDQERPTWKNGDRIHKDALLRDIVPMLADGQCVSVVDDDGAVIGEISAGDLIAAIRNRNWSQLSDR